MFVVFVSHLARPAEAEAGAVAAILGVTEYEARLALVTPAPAVVQTTSSRDRATDTAARSARAATACTSSTRRRSSRATR